VPSCSGPCLRLSGLRSVRVEVTADERVADYVIARGGVLWVRSGRRRCCGGSMTVLRTTTTEPANADDYDTLACDLPFTVRFLAAAGQPAELTVELRGAPRRPAAYWDGCAYKV
jgi:hypothetical protein